MRATVYLAKGATSFEELKPACQVLILHEDFPAYTQAVEVCRRIMEQFADELDFEIKRWNFIELADPNCARQAAKTAGAADIILLSMNSVQVPVELDRWLDFSFASRFKADGAFVLVLNDLDKSQADLEKLMERLQQLAGRMRMDFISISPADHAAAIEILPAAMMRRDVRG
jgi:hypothetical protein